MKKFFSYNTFLSSLGFRLRSIHLHLFCQYRSMSQIRSHTQRNIQHQHAIFLCFSITQIWRKKSSFVSRFKYNYSHNSSLFFGDHSAHLRVYSMSKKSTI